MDNSGGFKYKILGPVGPMGRTLVFFVCLGIAEILGLSGFFCLCRGCPTRGLSTALWVVPPLLVLEGLWGFVVWVTELLK